jgi:hypothetical protein
LFFAVGGEYGIKRIALIQQRRRKLEGAPKVLALFEQDQKAKLKVNLVDVRDLIISLQLGTSMESTLSGALLTARAQFAERGILGERLRKHVDARLSTSPDAVLAGLVEDFDCPQLAEVLDRIRMAAGGGISYNRVLAVSASSIEEDIRSGVERQIQRAPMMLTIPMVAGVFLPALALGLIPMVAMITGGLH